MTENVRQDEVHPADKAGMRRREEFDFADPLKPVDDQMGLLALIIGLGLPIPLLITSLFYGYQWYIAPMAYQFTSESHEAIGPYGWEFVDGATDVTSRKSLDEIPNICDGVSLRILFSFICQLLGLLTSLLTFVFAGLIYMAQRGNRSGLLLVFLFSLLAWTFLLVSSSLGLSAKSVVCSCDGCPEFLAAFKLGTGLIVVFAGSFLQGSCILLRIGMYFKSRYSSGSRQNGAHHAYVTGVATAATGTCCCCCVAL